MALMKCSECGTEISDKAKTCVKCGAPVKRKVSGARWIIAAPLALFVFYVAYRAGSGLEPVTQMAQAQATAIAQGKKAPIVAELDQTGAKLVCKDFVRMKLPKPFNVEFPRPDQFAVETNKDDQEVMIVSGYARDQSGDHSFNCTVKKLSSGQWQRLEVSIFG